jgi:hypothetical protein
LLLSSYNFYFWLILSDEANPCRSVFSPVIPKNDGISQHSVLCCFKPGAAVLGFSSMEFVVMIEDDGTPPVTKTARFQSFRNLSPSLASAAIVDETPYSFWNATMVRQRKPQPAFTLLAGQSSSRAAQSQAQGAQSALAELCRLYWYPLYIFARRRGYSPDDAEDLTQGFFRTCWEIERFDQLKGKFPALLLASFQNYMSDAGDRARLKAEALHLADRTSEVLEAINEAEALVERSEERWWRARTVPAPRCVSYGNWC